MFEGKVIWFNVVKGYGFIQYNNEQVFVHYSNILGSSYKLLNSNEIVTFDLCKTDKGLSAINVKRLCKVR